MPVFNINTALKSFCVLMSAFVLTGCCGEKNRLCDNGEVVPRLYVYKTSDITTFLGVIETGRPDEFGRNSTGTELRIRSGDKVYIVSSGGKVRTWQYIHSGDKVFIVSSEGEVREFPAPAHSFYMNDEDQVVAWTDGRKKRIVFKNGEIIHYGSGYSFGMDPGRQYFYVQREEKAAVEIASTDEPGKTLAYIKPRENELSLDPQRIFFNDNKVFFFFEPVKLNKEKSRLTGYRCQIYEKTDSGLVLKKEIDIPPFYYVEDVDPLSGNVLVGFSWDIPFWFLSSWHLLDPETGKLKRLGRVKGHHYGIFLQEDLLTEALTAKKDRE